MCDCVCVFLSFLQRRLSTYHILEVRGAWWDSAIMKTSLTFFKGISYFTFWTTSSKFVIFLIFFQCHLKTVLFMPLLWERYRVSLKQLTKLYNDLEGNYGLIGSNLSILIHKSAPLKSYSPSKLLSSPNTFFHVTSKLLGYGLPTTISG